MATEIMRNCSAVLTSVAKIWRMSSSTAGRKKHKNISRASRMGPIPMSHNFEGNQFECRDFDVAITTNQPEKGGCSGFYINRNPRSPELMGIAEKPKGFKTRKWRVDYYHRLMLEISSRHVTAYVNHNCGRIVAEASTKEFCISKHLYKTSDVCAAYNVGRVLAHRCLESGMSRMIWEHKRDRHNEKVKAFIRAIHEGGIRLNEPKVTRTLPLPGEMP